MLTPTLTAPRQAEFRRTRTTDNPLHIVGFLSEWKKYLDFHEAQVAEESGEVEGGAGQRRREGQKLQEELFEKVSGLRSSYFISLCLSSL